MRRACSRHPREEAAVFVCRAVLGARWTCGMRMQLQGVHVTTLAVRGSPVRRDISPKKSPARSVAILFCGQAPFKGLGQTRRQVAVNAGVCVPNLDRKLARGRGCDDHLPPSDDVHAASLLVLRNDLPSQRGRALVGGLRIQFAGVGRLVLPTQGLSWTVRPGAKLSNRQLDASVRRRASWCLSS